MPSLSLSLPCMTHFKKNSVFVEGSKVAVCRGGAGAAHVVDVATGQCIQSLEISHGLVPSLF